MIAPVLVCPNVKSWKREMKWMRSLQTRIAVFADRVRTRTNTQFPEIVRALMYALPTCPRCTALWLKTNHHK